MTILLLGDSNLVVLQEQYPDLVPLAFGGDIESRAVGGAWSGSLRGQVGDRDPESYDAVVLSIGSSDSHPPYGSSLDLFRENVTRELERGGRWVALVPPGLVRALEPYDTAEINVLIREYAEALAELVTAAGGTAIRVREVTDRLGPAAFDPDGMHLSRAAYEGLVPQIAEVLAPVSHPVQSLGTR